MKLLIEELSEFYSRKTINKLSSTPKKIYKSILIDIFCNRLLPEYTPSKSERLEENFSILNDIRSNPKKYKNEENSKALLKKVNININRFGLRNSHRAEFEDNIISFMRDFLSKLQHDERVLFTFKDISNLINLDKIFKDVYRAPNIKILHHHWIEFDIKRGLIPTYPDFIVYGQQLYLWNVYLEKYEEYWQLVEQHGSFSVSAKNVKYELDSLHTSLIVKSVTFVEAYLYFIYYNLSKGGIKVDTEQAKGILRVQRNVQDTDVIEKIIIGEYQKDFSKAELDEFKVKYQEYKRIVNIRDRLIHASAFEKSKDNHLIYLITGSNQDLITILDFNINFVLTIESYLPDSLKSLFWWNREGLKHPDYLNKVKGDLAVEGGFSI